MKDVLEIGLRVYNHYKTQSYKNKPRIKILFKDEGVIFEGFYREKHAQHHLRKVYIPFDNVHWDKEIELRGFYNSLL